MNVQVNDSNEITGYAVIGSIIGGVTIDDSAVPPYFFTEFEPKKFKLEDDKIVDNVQYIPPSSKPIVQDDNEPDIKTMILKLQHCLLDDTQQYPLFDMLKVQWRWNILTTDDLKSYVDKELINKEQYAAITNQTY